MIQRFKGFMLFMVEWESIEIFKMNCNCKLLLMSPKYIIFIFALKKDTWNANDNYTKKNESCTHSERIKQSILLFCERKRLIISYLFLNEQMKAPQQCSIMQQWSSALPLLFSN